MTDTALLLVLSAALAHASWNLLAKTARGETAFVAFSTLANAILWTPIGIVVLAVSPGAASRELLALAAASGALHAAYLLALNRGYRHGDLSVVYPLARGSGAMIAAVVACVALGERPGAPVIAGGALILGGVLALAGDPRRVLRGAGPAGLGWSLITGGTIAAITLWDAWAVAEQGASPLAFYWLSNVTNAALTCAYVARRGVAPGALRRHGVRAAAVGVLTTLSYVPILYALRIAPVSFVAPAREVSVLLGAAMGTQVLGEAGAGRRVLAAAAMVAGTAALALE